MANISFDSKKLMKQYGFFLGILVVLFCILVVAVVFSRNSWNRGLSNQIQKILNEYKPDTYVVEENISIKSPLAVSAACFKLIEKNNENKNSFAIILRMMTLYGPQVGVFTYDNTNKSANFIGFATLQGRIKNQLKMNTANKRILYWQNKLPEIIRTTGGKKNVK